MKTLQTSIMALVATALCAMAFAGCSHTSDEEITTITTNATRTADIATAHGTRDAADKAAVSTPLAKPVENNGGMTVVGSQRDKQYLYDLMQQPDFYSAFAGMDGAEVLPAWVHKGGTATPAHTVQVDGHPVLAAQACKPHDCPGQQVVLLYNAARHDMQGVFVVDPAPPTDAGISSKARFTWLGKPDDAAKAWLRRALTERGGQSHG